MSFLQSETWFVGTNAPWPNNINRRVSLCCFSSIIQFIYWNFTNNFNIFFLLTKCAEELLLTPKIITFSRNFTIWQLKVWSCIKSSNITTTSIIIKLTIVSQFQSSTQAVTYYKFCVNKKKIYGVSMTEIYFVLLWVIAFFIN